ncbi:nuclear pore complex protein Nup214 [Bradysia coprophila]|uniref:nuclear pore complex protein Nup214 n=1 Tax=Bradysia coprophila TaxID=38358 RepID=UPI00187DCFEF|nr:nuclear pore complex protein Nup214 [Bradysia coprophila]
MASEAPPPVDVTDIEFKLNSKFNLVNQVLTENRGNLLAAASAYGLVIVGGSEPNLKVIQLSRIVSDKDKPAVPTRSIPLPVPAHSIALSCDHSMLAVNFKQNELAFVTVFSVPSFLSNNIKIIHQNIRLCTDDGVTASQLLWNPVLPNTLAICLSNKSLLVFTFKDQGYDFYSIDKSEQVGCASWSPKGKQIVAGFPNGKIAQYKPDLKLARTIPCIVRMYNTTWDVIAIQWLSTYQFAAVMLPREENAYPALYIVYAPKNGTPTYTSYNDVCYSQSGPRSTQIILSHILPWNLLLVISANSTEVGLLGTTDTGDNPLWKQYITLDAARAELPLFNNKDETFPLGMDIDTGVTHRIVVDENEIPVMAMLHLFSTHGFLISFNILNKTPNCPSINSPPQLLADTSGIGNFTVAIPTTAAQPNASPPKSDISFAFPASAAATSTPRAPQKTTSIFNANEAPKPDGNLFQNAAPAEPPKAFSSLFGGQTTIQPISSSQSAFSFVPKSTEPPSTNSQPTQASVFGVVKPQIPVVAPVKPNVMQSTIDPVPRPDNNKPFITVAPTFSQPAPTNVIEKATRLQPTDDNVISDDDIIRKMIREEVQSYESLAKTLLKRCKSLEINIGSKEESQSMMKELKGLQEVSDQATESTEALAMDIQSLKVSLSETYLMIVELKSKHSMLNDANYSQLNDSNSMSHTSRRQLEKLEKLLAVNENQYRIVSQQINAHWSTYEENKKKTTRAKMHVPTLENIYQTLTKQRDIVSRQRIKINHIKSRLGYKDNTNPSKKMAEVNINLLTDSMVTMSLCDQVKLDTERLSTEKLSSLRDMLKTRKILQITPKRPERTGLSSEVVLEKRRAQEKKKASAPRAVTTPKPVNVQPTQKPIQSIGNDFPQSIVPDTGFQLSKSTSKTEFSGITNAAKSNSKVAPNNSLGMPSTTDARSEIIGFGSAAKPMDKTVKSSTENIVQPFSAKPTIAFGGTSITSDKPTIGFGSTTVASDKPGMSFGSGLFNNLGTASFGASNTQPSVLFGSTPTPIPFGSQTTNTASILKKVDSTKPEKTSAPIDATVPKPITVTKTADKENVHKIEVPKPVLGGLTQSRSDTVQKPTPIQPISSSFGIVTSAPVVANPTSLTMPFGTTATTKESGAPFSTISSGQPNEAPKISFTAALPAAPIQSNATNNVPVSTTVSSSSGTDFSFSLDKMGITPKTTAATGSALQKPLFNLDPKIQTTVAASSEDAEKLLGSLTFCKPTTTTTTDQAKTTATGGNIFSMSSFTTPTKSENASSIFGGNAASSPFSNFGSTVSTAPNTPTTQPSVFASSFASPNVTVTSASADTSSTGIFGKTDQQSPFGQQKTNSIFGGAATTTANSLFGGTVAATPSTNVFGGNAFETASSTSSPFGATANTFGTPTSAFGATSSTNTFGTPTTNAFASSTSTSNIFGNSAAGGFANAGNAFGTSKSIFGGGGSTTEPTSTFGSTGGSLFGAPNAPAPAQTSPFSQSASQSTGSLFGGSSFAASPQQSTGSIFGGASASATSGFGQSTSVFGGSSFSQQSSPFGGAQAQTSTTGFGSQPTFGGQATFGAAPTFGSPKSGFGSFANVANTFGTSPTQQNSLFETLGSSDTGLSFGNIAQNSNAANSQKTAFGGGSFSTWR